MGISKDCSVNYTIITLFMYMNWVASCYMMCKLKHWSYMLWSDKSLEEKIGADLEDFLGRQIMNTKGQKVIYKK